MERYCFWVLYHLLAKCLPPSYTPILGKISKKIRFFFAKKAVYKCGFNVNFEHGSVFSSRLEIGNNSGVGVNCKIFGKCFIGDDVMIGCDVLIFTRNHEFKDLEVPMRIQGMTEERPVHINSNVWIGARSIILPGVSIGEGCIIGAGSIVTKSFPANCIICGNPARIVKKRF